MKNPRKMAEYYGNVSVNKKVFLFSQIYLFKKRCVDFKNEISKKSSSVVLKFFFEDSVFLFSSWYQY